MPSSARWYRPRQDRGGGYQSARGDVGRRTAAHGDSCSRRGHCPCRMHPPFSFPSCGKENGPYPQGVCRIRKRQSRQRLRNRTVQKKRPLGRAPVQWPSALTGRADGSRRIGASADFGPPSGTLYSFATFGTAVPWRMVRRLSGWLSHCLCFSFRCRWPGGQREPVQRADEGIGPYGDAEDVGGHGPFAGMRKVIRFPGMRKAIAFCANGEGRSFFRGMWKGTGLLRGY